MENTIENTCRSCLRTQFPMKNLLAEYLDGKDGVKLAFIFENLTSIELPREGNLPQMICVMCELNLKTCYYFRLQCSQTNQDYLKIFNKLDEADMLGILEEPPIVKPSTSGISGSATTTVQELAFYEEDPIKIEELEDTYDDINETDDVDDEMSNDEKGGGVVYHTFPPDETPVAGENSLVQLGLVKKQAFVCDKCHKTFMNHRYLEIHMKTHQPQEYQCEVCTKRCSSKSVLRIHMKKHEREYGQAFDTTNVSTFYIIQSKNIFNNVQISMKALNIILHFKVKKVS